MSPGSQYAASGASNARFDEVHYTDDVAEDVHDTDAYESREHAALVSRERLYSMLLGGVAGSFGGAAMMLVARAMLFRSGSSLDPATALGERVHLAGSPPEVVGLGLAVAIGAVIGVVLGRSTWRVTRVVPRILFFSILMPIVWLFAQVFLIGHMSRDHVSAVPFVPFLVGSLAYAFFVAVIPAIRRSRVVDILPEK